MTDSQKESLLSSAKTHLTKVRSVLSEAIKETQEKIIEADYKVKNPPSGVEPHVAAQYRELHMTNMEINKEGLIKLETIYPSPYFVRCEIRFDGAPTKQNYYFAKGTYLPESIFSWIVPAAQIRFYDIGKFSYVMADGREIYSKDQFMIVDGNIVFMSTESSSQQRQLVYQEYLSNQNKSFGLKEIVEVMEKAQDAVIRAHHKGSFLISGPAGSGKTTLALHRVAYLTQSPETMSLYPGKKIVVFVQDQSTKDYFSKLLPDLGINNVNITTFPEWAFKVLNIKEYSFTNIANFDEELKDNYEFDKNRCLKNFEKIKLQDDFITALNDYYKNNLKEKYYKIFKEQIDKNILDKYDLTLLLYFHIQKYGYLTEDLKTFEKTRVRTKFKEVIIKEKLEYSLIIVDEVQNYLAEQINIFQKCISDKTKSMLYVGDLAQKTQLSTIKSWDEVGEDFESGRKVVLAKVYRNTKQILNYINSIGFNVEIPEGLRDGKEVHENSHLTHDQQISYINDLIKNNPDRSIGVITKNLKDKEFFISQLENNDRLHILTINESQGVEFQIVCLAGISNQSFKNSIDTYKEELLEERKRIDRDLIYVALTRAIDELHVVGEMKLSDILLDI